MSILWLVVVQILLNKEAVDQAASEVHANKETGIRKRDFLSAVQDRRQIGGCSLGIGVKILPNREAVD